MDNNAKLWLNKIRTKGHLSAYFVDCQAYQYSKFIRYPEFQETFNTAQKLAVGLRKNNVPVSHFMYSEQKNQPMRPFKYGEVDKNRMPYQAMDFKIVIPEPNELVFPKIESNGFTNPYAVNRLYKNQDNRDKEKTLAIFAGFMADDCLAETIIGSFNTVSNPKNHQVIVAIDGTNLTPNKIDRYMIYLKNKARTVPAKNSFIKTDLANNITHAKTEEILRYIEAPHTPPSMLERVLNFRPW